VRFSTNTQRVLKNSGFCGCHVICSNRGWSRCCSAAMMCRWRSASPPRRHGLAGTDYQAVSGTLVFTNGVCDQYLLGADLQQCPVDWRPNFTVALTNVTAPGVLTTPSTQTVVIVESNPGFRFSQSITRCSKTAYPPPLKSIAPAYTNNRGERGTISPPTARR